VGRHNIENLLCAAGVGTALGIAPKVIGAGLEAVRCVPGRLERVAGGRGRWVYVDYSHTPDALENALAALRALTTGRIICVFGCGGDRDRTKRPLMGAVAGRLSDLILITSDNPRSEDPQRIIDEVLRGITVDTRRDSGQRVLTIADRRDAIDKAIELARPGDLVLIAGKGHEKYQVIGNQVLPFDDVTVAREALTRRRSNSGVV
jgi:UDP-N-acetylmuramyl-tripeptide synthetase